MNRMISWAVLIAALLSVPTAAHAETRYVRVRGVTASGRPAWVKIPEALVPGSLEVTAEKVQPAPSLALSGPGTGCWTFQQAAIQKNKFGQELWRLTMSRHWCGTFGVPFLLQITAVAPASVQPNIKGVGAAWEYKGLLASNTDLSGAYYTCCGSSSPRAGNAMWATGEFKVCVWAPIIGTVCIYDKFPHIWINAHYNGNVAAGANNAGLEH